MSNLYRGPSIAATYQVSVHLAKRFQSRKLFMNRPISNTNCLCWPCLLTHPKLAIFIEGLPQMLPIPRFGSFGQAVSEQKICWESINQQHELPVPTMFAKGSGLNEQSLQRACHICFLPSQVHLAKRFQRRRFLQESTNYSKKNIITFAHFNNLYIK